MAYREETDRLRVRVEELEHELADAKQAMAELQRPGWSSGQKSFGEQLAGGRLRIVREVELDGELPVEAQEDIVEALRRRFGVLGQTSNVGRTLAWSTATAQNQRQLEVSIAARDGVTVIRATERLGNLAGGLFGGIVGGLGGGGMGFVVPGLLAIQGAHMIPFAAVLWVLVIFLIVRGVFARLAGRREHELDIAIKEMESIGRRAIARAAERVRVEAAPPVEANEPEPEAEQERARARRER